MSFQYHEYVSTSPLVKSIWHTKSDADGVYLAAPDGCWDIIIFRQKDQTKVIVCGQGMQAAPVPYAAGSETLGISLRAHAYLAALPGLQLARSEIVLPEAGNQKVWLHGERVEVPTLENIDTFVAKLVRAGMLQQNEVVSAFLGHTPKALSERTAQRHFLRTTGLTPYHFVQLQRAQQAVVLLQQGKPAAAVAAEVGYTDQPHMARSLKLIMGRTPAELAALGHQ